jgi:hypothetical protein
MKLCKIEGAGQGAYIDDELVMIHAETGKFFSVKQTGLQIWNMLDSESELEAIERELERRYEVDTDACRTEVRAFADQLVEAGFARYC